MKIDFSQELVNVEGEPLKENDKPVPLWRVALNVLLNFDPQAKMTGEEKARRYTMATRLVDGGVHDLPIEDVALLKKIIGELMPPLVVGQVWQMLETPAEQPVQPRVVAG